jgi:hypothetical protein
MGGKSGGSNASGELLAQTGRELFEQSQPLRDWWMGQFQQVMGVPPQGQGSVAGVVEQPGIAPGPPGPGWREVQNPDPEMHSYHVGPGGKAYEPIYQQVGAPLVAPAGTANLFGATAPPEPFDVQRSILTAGPYREMRRGLEDQFSVAEDQLLATLPRGGRQDQALSELITARAESVGGLESSLIQDLLNKSFAASTGMAQQGSGALSSAGAFEAQQKAAALAAQGAKGQGLGTLGGLGLMALIP